MKNRRESEKADLSAATPRRAALSRREFVAVSASTVAGLACAPCLGAAEAPATTAHGPRAEVKPFHGVPWLFINGKPPDFHIPSAFTDFRLP